MNKAGIVYRGMLEIALKDRDAHIVERELARTLGVSHGIVSHAVAPLKRIGAVSVQMRYFVVADFMKALLFWSANRRFERDIRYRTYVGISAAGELEDNMPDEVAYTGFSGYSKLFGNDAADYSEVYLYAAQGSLNEIMRRFPERSLSSKREYYNLFVLKPDKVLEERLEKHRLEHSSVSLPQLYADLWNNGSWVAYEFLKRLEKRISGIYAKAVLE